MTSVLNVGSPFTLMRKNTFLEVVSLEEQPPKKPRGRSAMSEPSRSRESTPQPGIKGQIWSRGLDRCDTSGSCDTPVLDTRDLNTAPVWNPEMQQCWSNTGGQFSADGSSGVPMETDQMEWANYQTDYNMFYGPQCQQWVCYDEMGQPMQVTFVPFEGECYPEGFDPSQADQATTAPPDSCPSAGSDTFEPIDDMNDMPAPRRFNRDTKDQPKEKAQKKEKKRKAPKSKTAGGKVFVGGLASKTTEETLMQVFSRFGTVAQANVLLDPQSRRSRGFGYVTFTGDVPDGVSDRDHLIDGRMCGARLYKY